MAQTIASYIVTPDGTKLQSFHVHDFKTHIDANGEEYMIDGGLDYFRTNVNKKSAHHYNITMDWPHPVRRESFHWGTYGKEGTDPLRWVALQDMETDHIKTILDTCNIPEWLRELFNDELEYRK